MQTLRSIGLVLVSGMAFGLGCQLIAGVNTDATYAEGSGGAGGASVSASSSTSSSTSGGGMGGMGGSPECNVANGTKDCVVDECNPAVACTNGVCIRQMKGENGATDSQLYGDCKVRACDGNGDIQLFDQTPDIYDYVDPCYMKTCMDPSMPMPNNGVMCETSWGNVLGTCKDFKCIECMNNLACGANKTCFDGRCLLDTCMNGTMDGTETAMDCGGMDCPPCAENAACLQNSDCRGSCDAMTMLCLAPSCNDTLLNADETDVDCGGSCATKCAPFKKCLFPNDCDSGVCKVGQCQEPTCEDQTKNQGEQAIDCGGPSCPPCPPGP